MEYYSVIRKEDTLTTQQPVTTQMDLEHIMLSEISQTERQVLYVITCMWNFKKPDL